MLRCLVLLIGLLATPVLAQDAATLIADSVELTDDRMLIAEGNVEIFQGDTRLTARRVSYDGERDLLTIDGPIELRTADSTVILASQAQLSKGLQDGILTGARLVFDQQLQIAAAEIERVQGRYLNAHRVAATSCHVCETGRPPLWEIRARRIVHDQEERQLYFDDAQLRILGTPVFYLPRLRLPDPTLNRATGLLFPRYTSSTLLGLGAKIPYFVTLGDHADITVTPWFTENSSTLELRYRQSFANGDIEWDTFISNDNFSDEGLRAGVLASGSFLLSHDIKLKFDIEAVSARAYFSDYSYSDKDRLDSALSFEQTDRFQDSFVEFVGIRSRRDGETDDTFPGFLVDGYRDLRFPTALGGDAVLSLSFNGNYRSSTSTIDADGDGLADGVDVARTGMALDWRTERLGPMGLLFGVNAALSADAFYISDDPGLEDIATRTSSGVALSVRWPLIQTTERGVTNVVEPHVQLAWSAASGDEIPNQDATRVEFDEGNLFALNRAPGFDVVEIGTRVDLGVSWTRTSPDGWNSTLTVGKVERIAGNENDFTVSSGLADESSDWIVSGILELGKYYDMIGRVLLNEDLSVIKSEMRVGYRTDRLSMTGEYTYIIEDPDEDRTNAASELVVSTDYEFNDAFSGTANWRYDFRDEATTEAGLGIRYVNECVELALSVSRNFTASGSVSSNTDYDFKIGLLGFGTGSSKGRHASSCR